MLLEDRVRAACVCAEREVGRAIGAERPVEGTSSGQRANYDTRVVEADGESYEAVCWWVGVTPNYVVAFCYYLLRRGLLAPRLPVTNGRARVHHGGFEH